MGVDVGVTVVLRGRELVFRRERTFDGPDVQQPPVGPRLEPLIVRDVGELDDRLALRERGKNPIRDTERAQSRYREASSKNLPTCVLYRHRLVPSC